MKKTHLLALFVGLLLSNPAAAQSTPEQQAEIDKSVAIATRARTQLLEAEQTAMERCDTTRTVISLPYYDPMTKSERTRKTTVTIDWKGGCVDGKRDGNGTLHWVEEQEEMGPIRTITNWTAEGRFVKGRKLGLWCMTMKYEMISSGGRPPRTGPEKDFCAVYAGHAKPLTEGFRKQADGSWVESLGGKSKLPAGALEAQSARLIADAGAGKSDLKINLVAQNEALNDLLPGAKITLALTPTLPSLKGKRVAIVQSSGMLDRLEQFKRDREALITASSRLSGESAGYRQRFIAASAPDRILLNAAKMLRAHNVSADPADDLVGLQRGKFDYAIVLDWKPELKKGGGACDTPGGYLISRELKAIGQIHALENCSVRSGSQADQGDTWGMKGLAEFYERQWGKNVDDTGLSMIGLKYLVKN